MWITFIINGKDCKVNVDSKMPVSQGIWRALVKSNNTGKPEKDWELRDATGILLERNRAPHDLNIKKGDRFFLSLAVGGGGEYYIVKTGRTSCTEENKSNAPKRNNYESRR